MWAGDGDVGPLPFLRAAGWGPGGGGRRLCGGFGRWRAADDAAVDEFNGGCRRLEERGDLPGAAGGDGV